jgi:hypothetical protein
MKTRNKRNQQNAIKSWKNQLQAGKASSHLILMLGLTDRTRTRFWEYFVREYFVTGIFCDRNI